MDKKSTDGSKKELTKEEFAKQSLDNNKDKEPQSKVAEKPIAEQPKPESFNVSLEGVDELVKAINETVSSKYVKQVIFTVINENFKPIFPEK